LSINDQVRYLFFKILGYTTHVYQVTSIAQERIRSSLGDTHRLATHKQLNHLTEYAAGSTTATKLNQQLESSARLEEAPSHSARPRKPKEHHSSYHITTTPSSKSINGLIPGSLKLKILTKGRRARSQERSQEEKGKQPGTIPGGEGQTTKSSHHCTNNQQQQQTILKITSPQPSSTNRLISLHIIPACIDQHIVLCMVGM
jgi:hypothetical protein